MTAPWQTFALLLALAPIACCAPDAPQPQATPSGAPENHETNVVDYDWTAFGKRVASKLRDGPAQTPSQRAEHLAGRVGHKLHQLGVAPNCDNAGRDLARERYGIGHSSVGTCSDVTRCMQAAFVGAGYAKAGLAEFAVIEMRISGRIALHLNADHVAMVLLPDGLVFDPWIHGRNTRSFHRFGDSKWNGMPVTRWARHMQDNEPYNSAKCDALPEAGRKTPVQIAEALLRTRRD